MKVRKRNGSIEDFSRDKITSVVVKAMNNSSQVLRDTQIDLVGRIIEAQLSKKEQSSGDDYIISVFDIETRVYKTLINIDAREVAESYEQYRVKQAERRMQNLDNLIKELVSGVNEEWGKENSNKNARLVTTQRDYLAGAIGKDYVRRYVIPKDVLEAHDRGAVHIHDTDYLAEETRTNCELINLEDMFQNGTVINGVMIEKPKRFITACTIATQIITGVTSATYGGATITLSHLAPFVHSSRKIHLKRYLDAGIELEKACELAEKDTLKEINDGVQTFNYQILSMSSTNGQSPFLSTFMYLGEVEEGQKRDDLALIIKEMLKQRIIGLKNAHGAYIAPAFPKLILCLDRILMDKSSKYHYLLDLAAECTAKRLVPDYISEKKMLELKVNQWGNGDVYPNMGCRSFLTPDRVQGNIARAGNYTEGKGKYYGRFNIGVTTLNLPYIALESEAKNIDFFERLDYYAELAHKMQRVRAERLMKTQANVAPILWCYGALARLEPTDILEPLIKGGYATSSLGYSGLYEAVKVLTGENHYEAGIGYEMGKKIMHFLNDKTATWTKKEDIDYSLYGAPMESTTYRFAKACRKAFGEDVFKKLDGHDRFFITNSVHIPVFQEIDAFSKLSIESEYQDLSPGGNIIYIETVDLSKNTEVIRQVMEHIYEHCMYAEINTTVSTCNTCGASNSVQVVGEGENMDVQCVNCAQRDEGNGELSYAIRVCGYISTNSFNAGRAGDIQNRVKHIDNKEL